MAERLAIHLPSSLIAEREGAVGILRLNRPHKRNALDDETIIGVEHFFTSLPDDIVAVLQGAVVGGGLELAAATHLRVAERSAYYALPEGSRGIYVGGGGSVRLP